MLLKKLAQRAGMGPLSANASLCLPGRFGTLADGEVFCAFVR
jgi:hypothetical protein